ncbi:hypothetical protein ACRRTK_021936 [Alexandromys fortis]
MAAEVTGAHADSNLSHNDPFFLPPWNNYNHRHRSYMPLELEALWHLVGIVPGQCEQSLQDPG